MSRNVAVYLRRTPVPLLLRLLRTAQYFHHEHISEWRHVDCTPTQLSSGLDRTVAVGRCTGNHPSYHAHHLFSTIKVNHYELWIQTTLHIHVFSFLDFSPFAQEKVEVPWNQKGEKQTI